MVEQRESRTFLFFTKRVDIAIQLDVVAVRVAEIKSAVAAALLEPVSLGPMHQRAVFNLDAALFHVAKRLEPLSPVQHFEGQVLKTRLGLRHGIT